MGEKRNSSYCDEWCQRPGRQIVAAAPGPPKKTQCGGGESEKFGLCFNILAGVMVGQTIDSVYTHFRASFKETPEFAIGYFQRNAAVIDGIEGFASAAEVGYYAELSWHYLNAIFNKDHYNETIDEANKRLGVIEGYIGLLKDGGARDEWYSGILFLKGMAAFKLRNFGASTAVFRRLVGQDGGNDLYRKWLRDSLYNERLRVIHGVWAVSAVLLLFVLFFEEFIPYRVVKIGMTVVGFLGVVFNLGYEFWAKRSFRRR
ncbi:MAG TPA: hypothetical protein PL009_14285 [Flavipsychrobacter sp.]|nr:hypothetical protein [Flavipsychrobacter sp.]